MKILAIMGSPRKNGENSKIVQRIENRLRSFGDVEFEYLFLRDARIEQCRGCQTCYRLGDEVCPIKDDIQGIKQKMLAADGIIFSTPTYVLNVTGYMKKFIDRFSFFCHRPPLFNKHALLVCNAAGFGERTAMTSLNWAAISWGAGIADKIALKNGQIPGLIKRFERAAERLYNAVKAGPKKPKLMDIMAFKFRQKAFAREDPNLAYECNYWKEHGWLDPKRYYFNDIKVNPLTKALAWTVSKFIARIA